jgi:hypothetical protein
MIAPEMVIATVVSATVDRAGMEMIAESRSAQSERRGLSVQGMANASLVSVTARRVSAVMTARTMPATNSVASRACVARASVSAIQNLRATIVRHANVQMIAHTMGLALEAPASASRVGVDQAVWSANVPPIARVTALAKMVFALVTTVSRARRARLLNAQADARDTACVYAGSACVRMVIVVMNVPTRRVQWGALVTASARTACAAASMVSLARVVVRACAPRIAQVMANAMAQRGSAVATRVSVGKVAATKVAWLLDAPATAVVTMTRAAAGATRIGAVLVAACARAPIIATATACASRAT